MNIVHCKEYLDEVKETAKERVKKLKEDHGVTPTVKVIQLGDSEDSNRYVRNKTRHVTDIGANAVVEKLSKFISCNKLLEVIDEANKDENVHAIIVQKPLPSHISDFIVDMHIDPTKDLDCANPKNLGRLLHDNGFVKPCTPKGIVYLLKKKNIDLNGKNVLILGRSLIVGKPLQILLTNENATVTLAHSKSQIKDFYSYGNTIDGSKYDIIISAIGKGHEVKVDMTENNCILIDVGINFDEDGKMIGDIDLENSISRYKDSWATPVPGGVGLLTCAMVIDNLLDLTERKINKVIYDEMKSEYKDIKSISESLIGMEDILKESGGKFNKGDIVHVVNYEGSPFNDLIGRVVGYNPQFNIYIVDVTINRIGLHEKYLEKFNNLDNYLNDFDFENQ